MRAKREMKTNPLRNGVADFLLKPKGEIPAFLLPLPQRESPSVIFYNTSPLKKPDEGP